MLQTSRIGTRVLMGRGIDSGGMGEMAMVGKDGNNDYASVTGDLGNLVGQE